MRSTLLLLLAVTALLRGAGADDTATVRQRLLERFCWPPSFPASLPSAARQAAAWTSSLNSSGLWPDINYNDPGDRTVWATAQHTVRLQLMSAVLSYPGSQAYASPPLLAAARSALSAWLRIDFQNLNWWWDILQTPQTIAASFLMLATLPPPAPPAPPFPSPFELSRSLAVTLRAAWWNASLGYEVTGTNLVWMLQAQLVRGVWPCLRNDSALAGGFARLWAEIKVAPWAPAASDGSNQGLQLDGSWHFHGPQLYTAGYGQDFLASQLAFVDVTAGTAWAPPQEKGLLLCELAEGMAYASAGWGFDFSTAGRQVGRNTWAGEALVQLNASQLLALNCSSATVARFAAAGAAGNASAPAAAPPGHRHYWTSDYSVFKREGWSAHLRMLSNRTAPNECGNGENLLGVYESAGVLNVVAEGGGRCWRAPGAASASAAGPQGWGCWAEYALLFPLLEWDTLNGATALTGEAVPPPCGGQCCWVAGVRAGARAFTGGASDGLYGVAAHDAAYGNLSLAKATLFFDAAIVSLGARLAVAGGGGAPATALASRFLRSDAARSGLWLGFANGSTAWAAANASDGGYALDSPPGPSGGALSWAYADGVGWVLGLAAEGEAGQAAQAPALLPPARVRAGPRRGNWSSIGVYPGSVQGDTLSLRIAHEGSSGSSFAYATVPGAASAAGVGALAAPGGLAARAGIGGLVNRQSLQAGAQGSAAALVLQAVFWEAGEYALAGGAVPGAWGAARLAVDAPAIVVLRRMGSGGGAVLAVAVPEGLGVGVGVTVGPSGCAPVRVAVNPAGTPDAMGSSVVVQLSCEPAGGCCGAAAAAAQ